MSDFINECVCKRPVAALAGLRKFGLTIVAGLALCSSVEANEKCRAEATLDLMREDLAVLQRLIDWQEHLIGVEVDDSKRARAHRLPKDVCRFSVLASVCDDLTTLFDPQNGYSFSRDSDFRDRYKLRPNPGTCES